MGPTRPSQSTGSLVAHLAPDLPTYWMTGTSGPCTGIFKPVYLGGAGLPDLGPAPTGKHDGQSLWWAHEGLQRAVIRDYATRMPLYRAERDALEATFRGEAREIFERWREASPAERAEPLRASTASCFARAKEAEARWTQAVSSAPVQHRPPLLFTVAWNGFNKEAGFPAT
jgi:dipeptidase